MGLKKRKILKGFDKEIDRGRTLLKGEVSENLKEYIGNIRDRIDSNFSELDGHLADEKTAIDNLESRITTIDENLEKFDQSIQVDL